MLRLFEPTDAKQEGFATGVNKAKHVSLMLSCCCGHYLVYTECPCPATTSCEQQRDAMEPKRIVSVLPRYKPADARVCMRNMWCTLNALILACVPLGALCMLWCLHVYAFVNSERSGVCLRTIGGL